MTVHTHVAPQEQQAPRRNSEILRRLRLTEPMEASLAFVAGFFFITFGGPIFLLPSWSLRYALVLFSLPFGMWCLARLVARRDRPSIAGALFIVAALVSAVVSENPAVSIKGRLGAHSFVLMYAAVMGVWAIGRLSSRRAVEVVPIAMLVGMSVSIPLGVIQIAFDIEGGSLGSFSGRAAGFLDNAAFYGSAMAGGAAYCMVRAVSDRGWRWPATFGVFGFGAAISGSRGTTGALVVVLAALIFVYRSRRSILVAALLVTGYALAGVLTASTSQSTVDRLSAGNGDGRFQVWRYGLRAFGQRPVLGWGLGAHASAVRQFFTPEFTRTSAWDDRLITWNDPHNIVMLLLVGTGAVGMVFAGAFVGFSLRTVTNWPLAAMAGATSMTWMLQPASVVSLPMAMLAFGMCTRRLDAAPLSVGAGGKRLRRHLNVYGVVSGLALSALFLIPDVRLETAFRTSNDRAAESAERWVWRDAIATDSTAEFLTNVAIDDPTQVDRALAMSAKTLKIEPERPYYWFRHARRQLIFGKLDEALTSMNNGLELEPWNPSIWQLKISYAQIVGDESMEQQALDVVCDLDLYLCPTGSRANDGVENED